ncbi:uncharacterized protein LOC104897328 [Beta vulgaris subsp. vulgaris]|uniref:uncharacterized protein LOC104897328 n=1 Tax=Beta vulgaris subsp. vulgaris TaxID=3555 RepID=UPI00053F3252|nr:uncharacterized protein LOC104897328 [Beta vulgaris subsp. vulgaris]
MGEQQRLRWAPGVWNRLSIPKHKFIIWLSIQGRLQTREKLHRIGASQEDECCICGMYKETHEHLMFSCVYSQRLMTKIMLWLGYKYKLRTLPQWIMWTQRSYRGTRIRRQVLLTVIAAVGYQIWRIRNQAYWEAMIDSVDKSFKSVQFIVKHKLQSWIPKKCSSVDRMWIEDL